MSAGGADVAMQGAQRQEGGSNGYKGEVSEHSTHKTSYIKPRLCEYQNWLEWVGSCFAML